LRGERIQTVECVQIAEELRRETLVVDDRLGNAAECGSCAKRAHARRRALSRLIAAISPSVAVDRVANVDHRAHAAAPKRGFRLPRPVSTNVETMVRTTMSGWLLARNSTRHSATEPLPFGLTSITPA
jgi:hypothetical protein